MGRKKKGHAMIILIGSFEMVTDRADALIPAIEKLSAASRKDEGCVLYSWNRSADQDDVVRLLEIWESEDALKAHLALSHVGEFVEAFLATEVTNHKISIFDAENMRPLGVEFPFPEAPRLW